MSSFLEKNGHLIISAKEKGYKQLKYLDLAFVRIFLNKNLQKIIKHRKLKIAFFD